MNIGGTKVGGCYWSLYLFKGLKGIEGNKEKKRKEKKGKKKEKVKRKSKKEKRKEQNSTFVLCFALGHSHAPVLDQHN